MLHPHAMTTTSPTLEQLTHAVKIAESIAALEAELAAIFGNHSAPTKTAHTAESAPSPVKKKGGMSAAGRARVAAAQKLRWAKLKGMKTPKASAKAKADAPVKKRTMSPAVLKKLALAMKKRWADAKAGKGPLPNAGKK